MHNYVASHNLERYQGGLKDEEVVACSDAESFINVSASESNKW
jgi:hypothetical protein